MAMLVGVPVALATPAGATGTNCPPPIGGVFNNQFVSQTFTFTLASGSWDAGDQLTIAGSGVTNVSISVNGTVVASSSVAPLVYTFPSAVPAPAPTTLTLTLAGAPNEATISCVHINVAGLLNDLAGRVSGVGPGKSLANKVDQASASLAANDIPSACSTLQGFIDEVKAQSGKKITAAVAASLTSDAQSIRSALAC
jgi:hypothetical protein